MISKRSVVIISIVLLLAYVGLMIYFLIPKSYLLFKTAPEQVVIQIDGQDGKTITNGDTVTIAPGKHDITVSRDEFYPYSKKVDLKNGESFEYVVALTPLTDNAKKLLNNSASQSVMERFSSIKMDQQTNIINRDYPIIKILPIVNRLYLIYSCPSKKYPNNSTKIALCIEVPEKGWESTIKKDVKAMDYNLDDYELIWLIQPSSGG